VRSVSGPVRASLRYARKRRAAVAVLIIAIVVLGITAFTSYSQVRGLRRTEGQLRHLGPGVVPAFPYPIRCAGDEFGGPVPGPGGGFVVGPVPVPTPSTPASPPVCHFFSESEGIFGPPLPGDVFGFYDASGTPLTDAERVAKLETIRPQLEAVVSQGLREAGTELAPRRLLQNRERSAGTLWGVLFTVLFVSTLFGAEWRWGVWKTLLTHEPRRGRVLASKIVATWTLVAVGYAVVLLVVTGIDAVYHMIWSVHGSGGPSWASLGMGFLHGLPGLELYATLAAAFAIFLRGSMAGLGGPLLLLVLDGLLLTRFVWLRPYSPTQQVAALLPRIPSNEVVSTMWFGQILSKTVCTHSIGGALECNIINLKPIPPLTASLVLLAWIALACAWAYAMLRSRDVPV